MTDRAPAAHKSDADPLKHCLSLMPQAIQHSYHRALSASFIRNTTAIEGNQASLSEAFMLLEHNQVSPRLRVQDIQDLRSQQQALQLLFSLHAQGAAVCQDVICALHRALLFPSAHAGRYRTCNVYVTGTGNILPAGAQVQALMQDFEAEIRHGTWSDPIEKAAFVHCRFVTIHPFADGNGRAARLLMNLSLLNDGCQLTDIRLRDRDRYMQTIQPYAMQHDLRPFREFLASVIGRQNAACRQLMQACSADKTRSLPPEAFFPEVFFVRARTDKDKARADQAQGLIPGAVFAEHLDAWMVDNFYAIDVLIIPAVSIFRTYADLMQGRILRPACTTDGM